MDSGYLVCAFPSSVSISIHLKLCRCLDRALKMFMWFGYNTQINFDTFVLQFEQSHFSGILTMKVNGQWVPYVRISFFSYYFNSFETLQMS